MEGGLATAVLLVQESTGSYSVLEWTFIGVLVLMTAAVGWLSLVVVARIVEPRGLKALLRRIVGKA